jgi:hypothetical protein
MDLAIIIMGSVLTALSGGGLLYLAIAGIFHLKPFNRPPEPDLDTTPDPDVRVAGRLIDPELAHYLAAHVYGRSVRRRFNPADYPEQTTVKCLTCGHELIGGQFFWDTPLLDRDTLAPVGKSFQICMSCQPGDVEAITHGQ